MERWTARLLLSVDAVAQGVARKKALYETRCSYRQAIGADTQSFLWDHRGSPYLCFRLILGVLLLAFEGGSPTEHTVLPPGSQAWKSLAAISTQPHCKQGCSPQPGVFKGNYLILAMQSCLSSSFPQISCVGLFLYLHVSTLCLAFEAVAPLKEHCHSASCTHAI